MAAHATREADAIRNAVDSAAIPSVVSALASARRVLVVGWRNSHPVALHLRQQLTHARGDVRLAPLPGQVVGEELADVGAGDVVVAVGFRRRPDGFGDFLVEAVATGATVVLLADGTARHHAALAAHWIECPVSSTLAFDSYAAAMSVVSVLADGVLSATGRAARERASGITATYTRLSEVES
jgi:DNA-binding MurR/RpiR family transcriptional regulator